MLGLARNEKGQALYEFALVLPLFLLILMAIISVGLLIYTKTSIVYACSQGAEVGAEIWLDTERTEEEKKTLIEETVKKVFRMEESDTHRTLTITQDGQDLVVKLEYDYTLALPFVEFLFDDDGAINLEHEARYAIH